MAFDPSRIRRALQAFDFRTLFVGELGWDNLTAPLEVMVDGSTVLLHPVAQKRGMSVYEHRSVPDRAMRMKIERQVARLVYEHILIFTDPDRTQQVWLWVRREPGKPLAQRQDVFRAGQTGESLVQKLQRIAVSFSEEEGLTITDVTSRVRAAFDLERVTKRFYDRFKKEHDAFLRFIEGIPDAGWERWYASVMLNRLMFIYFVQKKGFLDDNQNYLRDRLDRTQGNYYHDFLCPLFFEGFARRERDRSPEINRLLGKVPYLNGGLFLKHQIEERYGEAIQIPNEAFARVFAYFDEYHWHLDEHPLRADNEINPDVLGYIFEKYINQKQMGAYYTKEDITEYIARNTVIPFLFDRARQECRIAFEGEASLWRLLEEDPNRYIYEPIKKGITWIVDPADKNGTIPLEKPLPLPENIAAGIDNVAQRGDWNTPATADYALPTEIWREVVARRQRYDEVRTRLADGEVQDSNDLITTNLNIQQFAQDVIAHSEGPELLRAFWKAITKVTVLDPTCGSGAFLFAALNILEPLYDACLDRMKEFVDEPDRGQKYGDFEKELKRIDQHPNRRYFVLKSIIINNLYGVDIMEEAVEIAKLRLFLKLVAQVEDVRRIEPLPDIDFNIRAGNTLVGFATLEEVIQAITNPTGQAPKLLLLPEDETSLKDIPQKAEDVDELFKRFRQQQTDIGGEVSPADKAKLRQRLQALNDELNRYLGRQYNADIGGPEVYDQWLASHQPFHWFVEFYGTLHDGGFDVIIGNPPFVEYSIVRKEYGVQGYRTETAGNLYAFVMERSLTLLMANGRCGLIEPVSAFSSSRMSTLRELTLRSNSEVWISNFGIRPSKLFEGAEQRLSIYLGQLRTSPNDSSSSRLHFTKYNRWYSENRASLFELLQYRQPNSVSLDDIFPKVGDPTAVSALEKLNVKSIGMNVGRFQSARQTPSFIYYSEATNYWVKALNGLTMYRKNGISSEPAHGRFIYLSNPEETEIVNALLNSSLFFFYFSTFSDGYHLSSMLATRFPITQSIATSKELALLGRNLRDDILANSSTKRIITRVGDVIEWAEVNASKSKPIIDEIDRVLAQHYGFTDEELDFIINYDIKYRMGDELFDEEDEGDDG